MSLHVHWHEGLFLLPHHLQRLQRSVFEEAARSRRLSWPYPFGIVEAQISTDELSSYRVRFDKLRVLLPSGVEINFPENADLPSLDVKPLFATGGQAFTLYIALPLWQPKRANSFEIGQRPDSRVKLLYKPVEENILDENTGDPTSAKPVLARRLNARLITDQDDRSDLEIMPVLRIQPATGEQLGVPKLDAEYIAPSLFLNASAVLFRRVRDLVSQVEASRRELVQQLTRGGFNLDTLRGQQFEQLSRLRILNRFTSRLPSLLAAPSITPFEWYLQLRELHGELMALYPDKDDFSIPDYQHENLFPVFEQLDTKIRGLLRGVVSGSFTSVKFLRESGQHAVTLTDDHLSKPIEFFLGVRSKLDPREVVRIVEDADGFKFMPRSMSGRAIRGVQLKEERIAPMQLPVQAGLTYFRVLRSESGRVWSQIQTEKAAVLRWSDADTSDFDLTLYMILA